MWITREHPWKDFFVARVGFKGWKILSTAWIKKWKTKNYKLFIINNEWKTFPFSRHKDCAALPLYFGPFFSREKKGQNPRLN